ncbi:hypothetical protein ABKA04_003483 [Annulohypoxylon sp. FPYF3050]
MASKKGYRPANNGTAYDNYQPTYGQKRKNLFLLGSISFILWAIITACSIVIATGCLYTNSLYIIQVYNNDAIPVQVQLGYFVSQFVEEFKEKNEGTEIPDIEESLSKILPISENLRSKLFPAAPPVSFLVIYLSSIISFWVLLAHTSHSRAYKATFAVTVLLNAYSLTIGFIVATTTFQACTALIFPSEDNTGTIQEGVFVIQNTLLQTLQWVVVALSVVLQWCIAGLFVQRRAARASGVEISFKPSVNMKSYEFFCCN